MLQKVALIMVVFFFCLTSIIAQDKKQDKKEKEPKPKIRVIDKDPSGAKWDNACEITTTHYVIQTDLAQEKGTELANKLEQLFNFLCKEFKFDSQQAKTSKFQYYAFSTLQKYREVAKKVSSDPGIYGFCENGKVYCYAEGVGYGGLYMTSIHEGTHQILNLYVGSGGDGRKPGFWIIEGFACFAGSLKVKDDKSYILGESDHTPLKSNNVQDVNMANYVVMSRNELYKQPGPNYIIGYALCHFLYYYQDSNKKYKYRSKFMDYIRSICQGQGERDSFEKTIGVPISKLQEEYKQYVKGLAGVK